MNPANVARGRLNRMRGLQFERSVIRQLRKQGFTVARVMEHDGFTHGVDILIYDTPWGLVPVQCKCSNDARAGFRGLREARENSPLGRYPLVVCFFRFRPATGMKGSQQILVNRVPSPPNGFELLTLSDLTTMLNDRSRALTAGAKVNTLSADGLPPSQ